MKNYEEHFMKIAIKEATKALLVDEVPIGCVIVKDNKVISRGHNLRESKQDVTLHAEIIAIKKANRKLSSWRLNECDIFITLEPCMMCMGAIIQARFKNIYYGAKDYKGGAIGSSINALEAKNINHHPNVVGGILEEECSKIITNYFRAKREKNI